MKEKQSEKQTGPETNEEDKPTLENYKSEEVQGKNGMKPKVASDIED